MSHHCEDEHHDHSHGHDHDAPIATNPNQSLYSNIDTANVRCFNTVTLGLPRQMEAYKSFLKDLDSKFNCSSYLQSDADCQMIIHIPFVGNCKLFSLILRTNANDHESELNSPRTIKLFKNFNQSVDFDTLQTRKEDYKLEHPENVGLRDSRVETNDDENTFVEHYLPRRSFQNCSSLTLFVEDNWSGNEDEYCRCYYLEIRGEFSGHRVLNNGVPIINAYEAVPNPLDHQKLENEGDEIGLGL